MTALRPHGGRGAFLFSCVRPITCQGAKTITVMNRNEKPERQPARPRGLTPRSTGPTKLPAGLRVQSQIKAGPTCGSCYQ